MVAIASQAQRIQELEETIKAQEADMHTILALIEPDTKLELINQALTLALQSGLNYSQLAKGVKAYTGKDSLNGCDLEQVKLVVARLRAKLG